MTCLRLLVLFISIAVSSSVAGQSGKEPSSSDILLAVELKASHEDAKLAAKSITDHYRFDYDESTEQVIVLEENNQHLMALENNVHHQSYEFYDDMSIVLGASAAFQNKKKKAIELRREKYASQDFFHTDTKVAFFNLQFETVGFQYTINFDKKYKDVKYLTSVYFHEDMPTLSKTISFSIPNWMDVELKEMNFDGYTIQKDIISEGDGKKYSYTIKGMDARISEQNAPGASHIYPHILVLAKSYERNGVKKNLFSSTQDLYNWYRSLIDMMKDDTAPLKDLVNELTTGKTSDIEKVKSIYYWVQDNIRYIAFEDGIAGFKPDECQNVLEKKYGDCKGMANLCKQMLTLAGFDARLTWIGTKHIAYDYSLPTLSADNHMICTVMLNGKPYFLDPTESFGAFDEYAERIQGRPALIENGADYILETVPLMTPKGNTEYQEFYLTLDGETLIGKANHTFHGESKSSLLYQLNNTETNERMDRLTDYLNQGDKDYAVSDLNHSRITDRDTPFNINYDVVIENKASQFGDEIYLSIDYYEEWKDAIFEERKLDYLFQNKILSSSKYIIEIPDNYKVERIPDPLTYRSEFLNMDLGYTVEGSNIIYTKIMELPRAEIKATEFEAYNNIIKQLSDYYDEQITLTKK